MNKGEWTNKENLKIVQINREAEQKGKNFMKRIKQRQDIEFLQQKRIAQNLVDNARRFEKESLVAGEPKRPSPKELRLDYLNKNKTDKN